MAAKSKANPALFATGIAPKKDTSRGQGRKYLAEAKSKQAKDGANIIGKPWLASQTKQLALGKRIGRSGLSGGKERPGAGKVTLDWRGGRSKVQGR